MGGDQEEMIANHVKMASYRAEIGNDRVEITSNCLDCSLTVLLYCLRQHNTLAKLQASKS